MNCTDSWIVAAGWPRHLSWGCLGSTCRSPDAFLEVSPQSWSGSGLGHLPETPFCCGLGSVFKLAVKRLPLGHGIVPGGLCSGCTPGAGSSCQAFLCTPRGTVSPDETLLDASTNKWSHLLSWGINCLGKKSGWKVKHCIIFTWRLESAQRLFL